MARLGLATSGKSLGRTKGFPYLRPADVRYTVRRAALAFLSIGALLLSTATAFVAFKGMADAGVEVNNEATIVTSVTTTGYGWESGIRAGQPIDRFVDSNDPAGYSVTTHDETGSHSATAERYDTRLRTALPLAIAAAILSYVSVVFLRTRRRWVLPAVASALLAAATPLQLEGSPVTSTFGLAVAFVVPTSAWAMRVARWPLLTGIAALAGAAFLGFWADARLSGSASIADAEYLRSAVAFWATVLLIVDRAVLPTVTGQPWSIVRPKLFDVVILAAAAAAILLVATIANMDPFLTGVLLVLLLAAMPAARRRLATPVEELLFGDVRQQAAAEASEAERARLARELHDVPLQELAAVIRRLEIVPGAEAESEDLRALAGHLRDVATELRPPVLDDLGLPAALEFLAEGAATTRIPVHAEITDDTGFGPERRPPTDVELAMYRIAAEAVANAVRHSGGTSVAINGNVAPDRVDLAIVDDGAGLKSEAARDAARRKRLGLLSMRRRAEAIDAELSIDSSAGGTKVTVTWRA